MGKISSEPGHAETRATHFSHPHPLTLISHYPNSNLADYSSCSGCKLKPSAGAMIYSCTTCNFFLHKACFEMPQKINHPFHKEHALDLMPAPAYAEGVYSCDACQEAGTGFSYHCKPCGVDLHILCAAAPLLLTSACHAHALRLTFGSPCDTKNFVCDVCSGGGDDHWLYRCSACGFDAHLKCATAARPQYATSSRSAPHGGPYFAAAAAPPPMQQHPMMGGAATVGVPAMGMNGQNNLALQAMMQMIQNNNAAMAQALLAGGGGFGGDRGLQQMMQVMSALNRSGIGGGGGIPGMDMFGGGGGLDSLQSLLGGGGLDFLGGLGGLF